jgi:dihydrofolate synthase/folylpolyglutamate synthase
MTYQETLTYLYEQLPVFHRIGAPAYKAGLDNIIALCELLGNPYTQYPCLHIAGTNGKGSTSHTLASILQSAGYKVGLYTSPHLKDFSERIRVNGLPIAENVVVDFVEKYQKDIERIQPSFFEITVALAFEYFAQEKIDVAVIEVGMGGRLDSTNIITPILSIITNIGYDHQAFLGDTLPKIAAEKAGIIKTHTPVVISEYDEETAQVFIEKADKEHAPLYFAKDYFQIRVEAGEFFYQDMKNLGIAHGRVVPQLKGLYQQKNIGGVLMAIALLKQQGWNITTQHIQKGIEQVITLTGLKGRWQILQENPTVVCDTGHNEDGIKQVVAQIQETPHRNLYLILGFSADKDLAKILPLYPAQASFHFCAYSAMRSMQVNDLQVFAGKLGIQGTAHQEVNSALKHCLSIATPEDLIAIGGSTFVVAEIENL